MLRRRRGSSALIVSLCYPTVEDPFIFFDEAVGAWRVLLHQYGRCTPREEIVAELTSVFLGQTLGFTAHTLEMNAAYLHNWLRVLRSDKGAIFRHAADAQRACDYLIARSETGRAGRSAEAA